MKRTLTFIILLVGALLLTACNEAAPTVGEATDFARACEQANAGNRIAVTGYLRLPDSFTGDSSVVLRLYAMEDLNGPPIGVQIPFGTEANQVEQVPDAYQDADLKFHLSDGSVAEFGTPVTVSGKVYFPLVDQDFVCGLENPLVELAE